MVRVKVRVYLLEVSTDMPVLMQFI